MKLSKKHVFSLVFCLLNVVISITLASDNSCAFILKNQTEANKFDPYFTGKQNAFLTETIEQKLKSLPIVHKLSSDVGALYTYNSLVGKVIEKYAQKNRYFPLAECVFSECLLTRKNPEKI